MKWLKHMADASDDVFIEEMESVFGLEGYARWWKMLEAIARGMDKHASDPTAEHSAEKWCLILKAKRKKLDSFLEYCQNKGKIKQEQTGNILRITCGNLMKLRDEYQRKSGQRKDTSTPETETDTKADEQVDKEKEKKDPPPQADVKLMADIWNETAGTACPKVVSLIESRKQALRSRFADTFGHSIDEWRAYCVSVQGNGFLTGDNDRGWKADFDWALQPKNIAKVMEGKYVNTKPKASHHAKHTGFAQQDYYAGTEGFDVT